ncbi:alkaline phosphatase-like protein [Hortaea werneckii]|nr:alkaline phosphatase-like protein [Hortaea werneckii]
MARGEEPLLQRTGSQQGSQDGIEEEDALLTGQRSTRQHGAHQHAESRWREIGLFAWSLIATIAVIILAVLYQHKQAEHPQEKNGSSSLPGGKRNLIFMVSDGMGPTSLAMTREWRQYTEQLPYDDTLLLDEHLIGQSRTRSSSSLVTDSAAGATAFSCGQKSYNGAISILPDHTPCGSVMEAAKRMGYTTGLVVTTRLTDATPAVFASHVRRREMEDEIAAQMVGVDHPLGRMVDLMFGGGRCHFLPNGTDESCRADDRDIIKEATGEGWNYIDSREDFDNLGSSAELPLMGLFAGGDVPYEIDRRFQDAQYPSLAESARSALEILSAATKDSEQGFFIMIEGSRIDHAGHGNDPAAQVHEVLAYDRTMAAVLDFINDSTVPTLMLSTSDHETGGLAAARQLHTEYPEYNWYPGVLANASHSAEWAAHEWHEYLRSKHEAGVSELLHTETVAAKAFLTSLVRKSLGIEDASDDEMGPLMDNPDIAAYVFADMISRRAQTGWSTHGHSGADVNIYTSDKKMAKALVGNHENTEVGDFLRTYLSADDEVKAVTKELREHMSALPTEQLEAWMGSVPDETERLDGQDHLNRYHGDHRKRYAHCDACRL